MLLPFLFTDPARADTYTLSLHDALPIYERRTVDVQLNGMAQSFPAGHRLRVSVSTSYWPVVWPPPQPERTDRKSTRLNSSHVAISYAVFCLKKKIRRTTVIGTTDQTIA